MGSGRSSLTFTNSYREKLFVAYMRLEPDCESECGEPWDVLGWINLDPGETETRSNATSNRWFYYYAEAADGSFWAGPFVADVSSSRFQKCNCLGVAVSSGPPPYHDVGFRELDTRTFSGVNFTE